MKRFFTRIANALKAFWVFGVLNRTRKVVKKGGFKVKFREYDMTVQSLSGNFKLRLRSDFHPFGYLSAAVKMDKTENVHGFAVMMYLLASAITKDEKLNKEVTKALMRYNDRVEKEAELAKAKENAAAAEQEHVAGVNAEKADMQAAHLSRAERRAKQREIRKILRKEEANKSTYKKDE